MFKRNINVKKMNIGSDVYFRINIGESIILLTQNETKGLLQALNFNKDEIYNIPF